MQYFRASCEDRGIDWHTQGSTMSSIKHSWAMMTAGVRDVLNSNRRVKDSQTTGNLSEEDVISMAMVSTMSTDLNNSARGDREKDVKDGRIHVRPSKVVHVAFVAARRELAPVENYGIKAARDHHRALAIGLPQGADSGGPSGNSEGGSAGVGKRPEAQPTSAHTPTLDVSSAVQQYQRAPEFVYPQTSAAPLC